MAFTTYNYTISTDFPGGAVNVDNLRDEIQTSVIVTALDHISTVGDSIDIVFKAALSTGDKTVLDNDTTGPAGGLIAAHNSAVVEPTATVELSEDSVVELKEGAANEVHVTYADKTSGAFKSMGNEFTANANTIASHDITVKHKSGIDLISGSIVADGTAGDRMTYEVNPNFDCSVFGFTVDSVATDPTIIYLSTGAVATLFAYKLLDEGVHIRFGATVPAVSHIDYDGKLHEIIDFDIGADSITLDSAPATAPSNGDKIYTTKRFLCAMQLKTDHYIELGAENPGGSNVPQGTVLRAIYHNKDDTKTAIVRYNIAYLVGR